MKGAVKARARLCRIVGVTALLLWTASTAHAIGFVLKFAGLDGPTVFSGRTYTYFLSAAGGASPVTAGNNWSTTLTDAAGAGATRDLTVNIQHVKPFGVGPLFTFNFNGLSQPAAAPGVVLGQAAQAAHAGSVDIARASVYVNPGAGEPPASAQIIMRGLHVSGRTIVIPGPDFKWSILNPPGAPRAITGITVTPSYRDGVTGAIFNGPAIVVAGNVPVGKGTNGLMPPVAINPDTGNTGQLSDYSLSASGSGQIVTTLGFMGSVDGTLNEMDMESALELFLEDGNDFFAPMFALESDPPSETLYANVDLTQWLSDFTGPGFSMPAVGDTFDISDGVSPDLPGYTFATSPFTFTPGSGLSSPDLLNDEDVSVRAYIDGDVAVPEPATLALLGSGVAALIGSARLRWKKGTRGTL